MSGARERRRGSNTRSNFVDDLFGVTALDGVGTMLRTRLPRPGDEQRAFRREIHFEAIGAADRRREGQPEALQIVGV